MQRKSDDMRVVRKPNESDPFLLLWKARGVPSVPHANSKKRSSCGEEFSAVSFAKERFPELQRVSTHRAGECGLLHRLDTDACGLLLFATTQASYDALFAAQRDGKCLKTYEALCTPNDDNAALLGGFPPEKTVALENAAGHAIMLPCTAALPETVSAGDASPVVRRLPNAFIISSQFRAYGTGRRTVRPVTASSNTAARKKSGTQQYITRVQIVGATENGVLTRCSIANGFRHQVRCHLAWKGLPVRGDTLYNAQYDGTTLQFECVALSFPHPLTGELVLVAT